MLSLCSSLPSRAKHVRGCILSVQMRLLCSFLSLGSDGAAEPSCCALPLEVCTLLDSFVHASGARGVCTVRHFLYTGRYCLPTDSFDESFLDCLRTAALRPIIPCLAAPACFRSVPAGAPSSAASPAGAPLSVSLPPSLYRAACPAVTSGPIRSLVTARRQQEPGTQEDDCLQRTVLEGREKEEEKGELLQPPVHSPSGRSVQGWTRLTPSA